MDICVKVCEFTEEAAKAPASMKAVPGTYRFKDLNGDDAITEADKTVIGNGQPRFQWGWNNSFRYKDFDLSFLISGVHGFDIYNKTRELRLVGTGGNIVLSPNPELLNRWTPENENTRIPGFVPQTNSLSPSDEFIEKGSYVKIKNITLGYTLPKNITQKMRISNLRVYASLQNPFLISSYSGLDPEVALKSPLTPGIDYGYYPNGRNYLLGLNLAF
ncbi:TonB-dependent receptor [Bacteroides salyersiae]|nr:TonB-dependent receptor [Bacteroides salyersiae]